MGMFFFNRESEKVEHFIIFFIVTVVTLNVFLKYNAQDFNALSFAIFFAMCVAGIMVFKAAKEIMVIIDEQKLYFYEDLKMNMLAIRGLNIKPSGINMNKNNKKHHNLGYTTLSK